MNALRRVGLELQRTAVTHRAACFPSRNGGKHGSRNTGRPNDRSGTRAEDFGSAAILSAARASTDSLSLLPACLPVNPEFDIGRHMYCDAAFPGGVYRELISCAPRGFGEGHCMKRREFSRDFLSLDAKCKTLHRPRGWWRSLSAQGTWIAPNGVAALQHGNPSVRNVRFDRSVAGSDVLLRPHGL